MTADVLEPQHAHALRPGVILADRFRLVHAERGTSPFAFSYQAEDLTTGESVVIKEFFPRSLVSRGADGLSVRAHSPECERDFLRALHRYALEGAVLAESTHPNLVRVRAVVDANATVYLVMNRHATQPLGDYVRAAGGRVASAEAGRIVQHLLSALQVLHTESIIHRDLSPRSVHVGADGSAILLEFSARRHLPLHATDLAPGFAAFEQYGMRDIGPWTDVYAVSALLYYMLTGAVPPSALDRAAGEAFVSPLTSIPGVAPGLARLAMKGMALLPQQRPHAVSELRRLLDGALAEAAASAPRSTPSAAPSEVAPPEMMPSADDPIASDYDRTAPLRLAAGGIVLPGEERGVRLLRMLGGAASRFRRSMMSNPRATSGPAASAYEAPESRFPLREMEPEPAPVMERSAPVVAAPKFSAPAIALREPPTPLTQEQPRGLDLAAEIALATDAVQSTALERENSRRKYSIVGMAALVLVVGGSLVVLARNGRASGVKSPEAVAPAARSTTPTSAAGSGGDGHVSVESGAVQQSTTHAGAVPSRTESDSPAAKRSAATAVRATPVVPASNSEASAAREPVLPAAKMPTVKIAVTGTGAADLKIVPPELLVDSRTRLTNGQDQVEQGEYATARRTFRSAILQLDSVATRFPDSQAIKNLKRDLEQADTRAVQACAAENEMRKRRGEQARACQ